MKKRVLAVTVALLSFGVLAQGQVNIICSVQAEWCNMIGTVYARTTGTKVNVSMKGSGEALAQLIAEKDNPKTDLWFGRTTVLGGFAQTRLQRRSSSSITTTPNTVPAPNVVV